jgi:hypothetical protein
MGLLFEQQPKEGAKAFEAFSRYLSMGVERSTAAVAKKLAKSEQLVRRWSAKYDWTSRVQAHGAHLAELERSAIEAVVREKAVEWEKTHESVKREAWREAEETIAMVRKAREEWLKKGRLPGWEGMARMLELGFKLKQFAAGMPSEVKRVETQVSGTIDVEWEIALRKAYGVVDAPPPTTAPVVDVEEVQLAQLEDGGNTTGGQA